MRKRNCSKSILILTVFIAVWSILTGLCFADPILLVETPAFRVDYTETEDNGSWVYAFEVANTYPGYRAYDFFVGFDSPVTLTDFISPADWDAIYFLPEAYFVDWISIIEGIPPGGSDLPPGSTLGGFGFTSDQRLTSLQGEVLFEPLSTPVPEPATLILLGGGLLGLPFLRRKRH